MVVLGCVRDLMFATRLRNAAAAAGHECVVVARAADVAGRLDGVDLVVIDLMVPGGGALDAIGAAQACDVGVVAYGEHVRAEVLDAARATGVDAVYTRSEFVRRLPDLLGG